MDIRPPATTDRTTPKIEEFRDAAALGDDLVLECQGESLVVVATGTTPSGRSVTEVAASDDVTATFVAAIAQTYGTRLAQMVTDELGLQLAQGKPLSSRKVKEALSMAESVKTALDGVRFGESLLQSASTVQKPSQD